MCLAVNLEKKKSKYQDYLLGIDEFSTLFDTGSIACPNNPTTHPNATIATNEPAINIGFIVITASSNVPIEFNSTSGEIPDNALVNPKITILAIMPTANRVAISGVIFPDFRFGFLFAT